MSRLLRKGAIIGKAALATIVAGLLLYGAASLLKAELTGEQATVAETPATVQVQPQVAFFAGQRNPGGAASAAAYKAAADSRLEAGDTAGACDAAKQMIVSVVPSPETGAVAEQIARKLAAKGNSDDVRDIYLYASKHATGTSLRDSLAGLMSADAEVGDGKLAHEAAARLGDEFAGDVEAVKALNKVADTCVRAHANTRACGFYRVVADKWAGTEDGKLALSGLGLASATSSDYASAAEAAARLQAEYAADGSGNLFAANIGLRGACQ